jgi:hypothetical protein
MPGEAIDAAVASSLPVLLPAPASIPAGAVADSPAEPPVAADVGVAEAPSPLVIPDLPILDHEERTAIVAEVGERRPVTLAEERPGTSTAVVPDASIAGGTQRLGGGARRTMARLGEQWPYPCAAQSQ